MKIFFIIPIQHRNKFGKEYESIMKKIKDLGHDVISDELLSISESGLEGLQNDDKLFNFHKKLIKGIKAADIVIAELSNQRTSMGYWISLALEYGKPTIALSKKGSKSFFLQTLEMNDKFVSYEYANFIDIEDELPLLIKFSSDKQDTRFNFFISPKHQNYMDWIAKYRKIPRSVYLRTLIEDDMDENSEYHKLII